MSDDSISDTGDVNEGEGAKVVQSNFREPSIISKSIIKHDSLSKKTEESKIIIPEKIIEPLNEEVKQETKETTPIANKPNLDHFTPKSKKSQKKLTDDFCFEIPKMHSIPIVNRDTTHPEKFDLNFLLNPEVQKIAKSGHRLTQSTTITATNSFVSPKNHIKQNIKNTNSHTSSISQKDLPFNSMKINSKKSSLDVDERFYNKAKKTEEKIKVLKEAREIEEINGCTFHPKINAQRKQKTYEEYYEYMNNFADKKDKKVKKLQEEEKKLLEKSNNFAYKPQLCERSLQIIARKSTIEASTFDRLHKFYQTNGRSLNDSGRDSPVEIKPLPQKFFHPVVNKKSQEIQRTEPIEKILYDDALRRLKKSSAPKPVEPKKFINTNSEKFLIEKLKRDFEEGFYVVDMDNTNEINYTRMIELFRIMHMIKDNGKKEEERLLLLSAWKSLTEEEERVYCSKDSVCVFVLAIMGFYEDWMNNPETKRLTFSLQDVKRVHKKFDLFYNNRISAIHKNSANKTIREVSEYSFQPHIGLINDKLAESFKVQNRPSGKLEDILIAETEKKNKKIEELRLRIEEAKMEECSFNPMIEQMPDNFKIYGTLEDKEDLASEYFKLLNSPGFENKHKGLFLHNLSKIYKDKKEVIINETKEKEIQKELENCTFAPQLEKRIYPEDYNQDIIVKPKELKSQPKPKKIIKQEENKKQISPVKKKIMKKKNSNEECDDNLFFNVISTEEGIAKISIKTENNNEILEFDLKNDDPTSAVMAFSSRIGLEKNDEYKLVKKLTLLKYSS